MMLLTDSEHSSARRRQSHEDDLLYVYDGDGHAPDAQAGHIIVPLQTELRLPSFMVRRERLLKRRSRSFFRRVNRMSFYFEKLVRANFRFERMRRLLSRALIE